MNQVTETIRVVPLPEFAKVYRPDGTLAVLEDWLERKAEGIRQERLFRKHRWKMARFPLEAIKPDTVQYRKPDGQTVEVKLPKKPFQLLEFIMGQQGMSEDMATIAEAV